MRQARKCCWKCGSTTACNCVRWIADRHRRVGSVQSMPGELLDGGGRQPGDPTPERIVRACAKIRAARKPVARPACDEREMPIYDSETLERVA